MNTPTPPLTHAELIAKSEARMDRARLRDNTDEDPELYDSVRDIADIANLSPHAANLHMLNAMFGKADVLNHPEDQIQKLLDGDGDAQLDEDDDGINFTFIGHDGCRFKPGHGRYKCSSLCSFERKPPHNCGYHQDYIFPVDFSPCSNKCKGAFCKCIIAGIFEDFYPDQF